MASRSVRGEADFLKGIYGNLSPASASEVPFMPPAAVTLL
jgi:hypothetical protein